MKIERLLKMIILLLDKKIISASSLAKTLGVTKRTIYRDIQTLEYAGFPILSYPGKDGGYGLLDTYKLHAFTFTKEDKQRIMDALKMQEELLPVYDSSTIMKKMNILEESNSNISDMSFVSPTLHNPFVEDITKQKVERLHDIILQHKKIRISYISNTGNRTSRIICPLLIKMHDGSWYMEAYCDSRKGYRVFKVTRITKIEVLDIKFNKEEYPLPMASPEEMIEIILHFRKNTWGQLLDFYPEEIIIEKKEYLEVRFPYGINKNLIPFLLMFGTHVKVLQPKTLRDKHIQSINNMQEIYTNVDI